ncbi:hypothetical protein BC629DRAFT_1599400 [Irpex lacteus]|nr:hypothetical protein BC629DRAFT_1599400 [Irpex lacteus]
MASAMFEFSIFKMVAALQYLSESSEWLAIGDNLGYATYELGPEVISQMLQQAKGIVRNLSTVRDLTLSTTGSSPEPSDKIVNDRSDPSPVRFRVSVDIEKVQGTTMQAASALRGVLTLYNKLLPVNRLPPELLGAIFEHTINSPRSVKLGMDPPNCPWPNIHSVCRRWRSIAIRTPALWSYICVRKRHYSSSHHEDREDIISTSFERSGALPLTIAINNTAGHLHGYMFGTSLSDDLLPIVSRIREVRLHRYLQRKILDLFASGSSGSKLEVLVLDRLSGVAEPSTSLFDDWRTPPRLQTLCVSEYTGWSTAPFHTLRHLVLTNQVFNDNSLLALHTLLLMNSHLEDLVLEGSNEGEVDDDLTAVEALTVLDMLHLKRISITTRDNSISLKYLVETKLHLEPDHAKLYAHIDTGSLHRLFPPGAPCFSPSHRLFLGNEGYVVGTNGRSAFSFHMDSVPHKFLQRYSQETNDPRIQELWLWSDHMTLHLSNHAEIFNESRMPRHWRTALGILGDVTKLVLLHDIPAWLNFISEYHLFPSLSNLQLHVRHLPDASPIIGFLESRASGGCPIDTLRFVLDSPTSEALESFTFCEENAAVFENVVRQVVFDDPTAHPPRMELPEVCLNDSSEHSHWTAWAIE